MTKLSHYTFLVFTGVLTVVFVKMLRPANYKAGVEVTCESISKN
jgi:hypothetical protein